MPIMSNRIFLSLVLSLSLSVISVYSYDPYKRYGVRDENTCQLKRCPTCPTTCPQSVVSPWYESPTVYGQAGPFRTSYRNFQALPQQGSYSARPNSDSSSLYGNPYLGSLYENSRLSCPYGCCGNARFSRSHKSWSEGHAEDEGSSRFNSVEPRAVVPYNRASPASSSSSFIPETYPEMGSVPADNHQISYGSVYKDTIADQTIDEESLGPTESKWNTYETYPEHKTYESRLKPVETSTQKKVFVVYRADADNTIDDDDLDGSLIGSTSRYNNYPENIIDSSSSGSSAYPMTDFQLEEIVRRVIAAATRQNINSNGEQLYDRQQGSGINYNEHERNTEESYNLRRPYNDDLYQRFNAEEATDREEQRKLYMTGFGPSEVVYTPEIRYNPHVLSENEYEEDRYVPGQYILEGNRRYKAQPISNSGEEYTSQREQTTVLDELREINREEEDEENGNRQEEKKGFGSTQDFVTTKRETDFETLVEPPPINYRTHGRMSETKQVEEHDEDNTSRPIENNTEKDDQARAIAINPDLTEDMEIPPIEPSEVELQLNFESLDNTTPSPTD